MSLDALSPAERSLRARIAAHALHSQVDSREHLAPATAASPANVEWFFDDHPEAGIRGVDPARQLSDGERRRRAEQAKKSYYSRLALKSSRNRRRKRVA